METKDLLCGDCGNRFARPKEYLAQERTAPLFTWTCNKCDECKKKRVNLAFKHLPKVTFELNCPFPGAIITGGY